jgi:hypothetical protein
VSADQAIAWGVSNYEKDVVVSFDLAILDLASFEHRPHVTSVAQSSDVDLDVLKLSDTQELGLAWLVKHRLASLFTPPLYPPRLNARPHLSWQQRARIETRKYDDELQQVIEATECSRSLALTALRQSKHEPTIAINALLDEGTRSALQATCVELSSDDVESLEVF